MIIAAFEKGEKVKRVRDKLSMYDYGHVLRIQGLKLPTAVDIQFSLDKVAGETKSRIGYTKDGVTDVVIPDFLVEKEGVLADNYYFYAFVYVIDETSTKTECRIEVEVKTRPRPEPFDKPEDRELFEDAIRAVNECAERAEDAKKGAEEIRDTLKLDLSEKVTRPATAEVGQVLAVKSVDEEGKPTEFEAKEMSGGGASKEEVKEAVGEYLKENPIEESDPTVPQWAKEPEKPKYTAGEVGALPVGTKIPTKTSDLENDSGFIKRMVSDLENYYLKSETYTQEEINQKLSAIPKFSILPVDSLPEENISETTVYLLIDNDETGNLYSEYIYVNNTWEKLGSQSVDLTGYALKTDIPTKLSELENDKGYLEKPATAQVGQIFKVQSVNEDGTLVLEAVDMPSSGVGDVQIEGKSIVGEDGVAKIPVISNSNPGLVRADPYYGIKLGTGGSYDVLVPVYANSNNIQNRTSNRILSSDVIKDIIKCGMTDGKDEAWTAEEQAAARERIGDISMQLVFNTELGEAVSKFESVVGNNGKPFSLSRFLLVISCPVVKDAYPSGTIYINDGEIGSSFFYYHNDTTSHCACTVYGDLLGGAYFTSYVSHTCSTELLRKCISEPINRVKLDTFSTDLLIPAGTKICLMGV